MKITVTYILLITCYLLIVMSCSEIVENAPTNSANIELEEDKRELTYEEEEQIIINDIVNLFLRNVDFKRIKEMEILSARFEKRKPESIEEMNISVIISDTLRSLVESKNENAWMFTGNYSDSTYSNLFDSLVNSRIFLELEKMKFNPNSIKLNSPYQHSNQSITERSSKETRTILYLSRVCIDEKRKYAVMEVEYLYGHRLGSMNGYHMTYLLEKREDNWVYIHRH
jgi:hypothetical protein